MKQVQSRMHMPEVTICYGMTETSPVSTQSALDDPLDKRVGDRRPRASARRGQDRRPGDRARSCRAATPGELCTRGYSVMLGYWDNDEATARTRSTRRGWMHTGDLATMDDEGYVNIVGRIKDMIIRGGENIYPREIEEFLYTHPDVSDVQVIGVPSERYGEEVMAWVKPRPGAALDRRRARRVLPRADRDVQDPALLEVRRRVPDDGDREGAEVPDARGGGRGAGPARRGVGENGLSIGLALAAAALWGSGDFLGGFANRATSLLSVLVISQGVGLIGMLVVAAVIGGSPSGADLGYGALAGLAGAAGVAMLYRGLASGAMSLVAPITGVVAVVVPIVVGVGGGERPAALQYAGIIAAIVAVGLLSGGGTRTSRLGRGKLLLAIGAGLGFGLFYVAIARTSMNANLWPLVTARGASVAVLLAVSAAMRRVPSFGAASPLVIIGAGVFDVTANALYLLAVHGGLLSIVAVLVSLYPVSTVLCSMVVLGEQLRAPQVAGVGAALVAVVLITAG